MLYGDILVVGVLKEMPFDCFLRNIALIIITQWSYSGRDVSGVTVKRIRHLNTCRFRKILIGEVQAIIN